MANDLVLKTFGGVEAVKKYAAAAYAAVAGVQFGDGKPILKLDKDSGDWFFGQEDTPLHKTDLLAVNPASFKHGFIAFDGNAVAFDEDGEAAEILLPITQPLPYRDELPRLEEPKKKRNARGGGDRTPRWMDQLAIELIVIDGKNKGAEMVFKPTSVGGLRMCAKLIGEVARRLDAGETDIVPLVELYSSSYNHRTYGEVFNPEHAIVEWKDFDDGDFVASTPVKSRSGAEKADPKEKTRRGDDVDTRRSSRRDDDEEERAPRGRRAARRDDEVDDNDEDGEPRRAKRQRGVDSPTDKVARDARRRRDEEQEERSPRRGRSVEDDADEGEDRSERRSRRGRDDDAGDAKSDASATNEVRSRGEEPRRARRGRDEDDGEADDDRASRRSRRDDDEDDRRAGPRGRNASAGGRRR